MGVGNKNKVFFVILALFLCSPLTFALGEYTIVGNSVLINDSKALIQATPHTITAEDLVIVNGETGAWVEVVLGTKQFTGDINILFGYDTTEVQPTDLDLETTVFVEHSLTCDNDNGTYWYNYTTNPNFAQCWTTDNNLVWEHSFDRANLSADTIYFDVEEEMWADIRGVPDSVNFNYDGKNKWYYFLDVPFTAGNYKKFRIFLKILQGVDIKYDIAAYPSSYGTTLAGLQQAVDDGNMYVLDPWVATPESTNYEKKDLNINQSYSYTCSGTVFGSFAYPSLVDRNQSTGGQCTSGNPEFNWTFSEPTLVTEVNTSDLGAGNNELKTITLYARNSSEDSWVSIDSWNPAGAVYPVMSNRNIPDTVASQFKITLTDNTCPNGCWPTEFMLIGYEEYINPYHFNLTINSSKISSDLTDFPVYVDLSDAPDAFWGNTTDCGELRVTNSDGTELPREIVSCNKNYEVAYDGEYTVLTFTGDSSIKFSNNDNIEVLVVGGGGSGGNQNYGGGGGAGGLIYNNSFPVVAGEKINVKIGLGGAGATGAGTNGENSIFGTLAAIGGGAGGIAGKAGNAGGSGGGASYNSAAGSGTANQGYSGGTGSGGSPYCGGGGGGASEVGGNAVGFSCGSGGDGIQVNITGTNVYYAGGGGAGANQVDYSTWPGTGGLGGGGNGGQRGSTPGQDGTNGTGGGGGGNPGHDTVVGTDGGSGVVIVRFLTASQEVNRGKGELHFKADYLNSSADTTFSFFYGNDSLNDYADDATYGAENVWSEYQRVFHFQTDFNSSTGTTGYTSNTGCSIVSTGKIGSGMKCNQDQASLLVSISGMGAASEVSIFQIANISSYAEYDSFMKNSELSSFGLRNQQFASGKIRSFAGTGSGVWSVFSNETVSANDWFFGGSLYDESPVTLSTIMYYNTFTKNTTTAASYGANSDNLYIGGSDGTGETPLSTLDEVRVMFSIKSDDYYKSTAESLFNPSTFYTITDGTEPPVDPNIPNATTFDGGTTNFTAGYSNLSNPILEQTTNARIDWLGTGLNFSGADFDSYVTMTPTSVVLDSENLPADVNTSAEITFYDRLLNPILLKDGEICSDCSLLQTTTTTMKFNVSSFSNYTVIEGETNVSSYLDFFTGYRLSSTQYPTAWLGYAIQPKEDRYLKAAMAPTGTTPERIWVHDDTGNVLIGNGTVINGVAEFDNIQLFAGRTYCIIGDNVLSNAARFGTSTVDSYPNEQDGVTYVGRALSGDGGATCSVSTTATTAAYSRVIAVFTSPVLANDTECGYVVNKSIQLVNDSACVGSVFTVNTDNVVIEGNNNKIQSLGDYIFNITGNNITLKNMIIGGYPVNSIIIGDGTNIVLENITFDYPQKSGASDVVTITGGENITITGGEVLYYSTSIAGDTDYTFNIASANNVTITDFYVASGLFNFYGVKTTNTNDISITDSVFPATASGLYDSGSNRTSIYGGTFGKIYVLDGSINTSIVNMTVLSGATNGFVQLASSSDVLIENCSIGTGSSTGSAMYLLSTTVRPIVKNNYIASFGGVPSYTFNILADNATIIDNRINTTSTNAGVVYFSGTDNMNFSNNVVTGGSTSQQVFTSSTAVSNFVFNNNIFTGFDNVITSITGGEFVNNTATTKLEVSAGSDLLIKDNILSGGTDALQLNGVLTNSIIESNVFVNDGVDRFYSVPASQNLNLVNQQIDSYSIGTSYITVNDTSYGAIELLELVSGTGTGFSNNIMVGDKFAYVNSSSVFNVSANVSLVNPFPIATILKDGAPCGSECTLYTPLTANLVVFSVLGWSNYSLEAGEPYVVSSSITPSTAYTTDTLSMNATCQYTGVNLNASWSVYQDGSLFSTGVTEVVDNTNTFLTSVDSSNTSVGENWILEVFCEYNGTVGDGVNTSRLISNTPPVVNEVTIEPTLAYPSTTLYGYCNASDVDEQPLNYNYEWFVNGVSNESGSSSGVSDVLFNLANLTTTFNEYDDVIFSCQANDSIVVSSWANSSEVTIQPQPDALPVALPSIAYTDDDLYFNVTCVHNSTGATPTYTANFTINLNEGYYDDGSEIVNINESTLVYTVPNNETEYGQNWSMVVYCYNNDVEGEDAEVNKTINNSQPVMVESSITPSSPYVLDNLVGFCNATDADEVDGQTLTYNYTWYNNSVLFNNENDSFCYQETANIATVCGGLNTGGYAINRSGVWINAWPNLIDGDWSTRDFISVGDIYYINYSKPLLATNNSIWQIKRSVNGGTSNFTIPNDCWEYSSTTLSFKIYINSSNIPQFACQNGTNTFNIFSTGTSCCPITIFEEAMFWEQDNIINSNYLISGDNWLLECTAFDGQVYSEALNSSSVFIKQLPYPTSVVIQPSVAYTDDTLVVNATCVGDDSWHYANYNLYNNSVFVSGGSFNVTNNTNTQITTISPILTTKEDSWTAEVFCGNLLYNGTVYLNATRYINNSNPIIQSVNITPQPAYDAQDLVAQCYATDVDEVDGNLSNIIFNLNQVSYLYEMIALREATDIFVEDGYAYSNANVWGYFTIVNVSNPLSPSTTGTYVNTGTMHVPAGIYVRNNTAFVLGRTGDALNIINITNRSSPVLISFVQDNSILNGPRKIVVKDNYAFITAYNANRFVVVDISNLSSPNIISSLAVGVSPVGLFIKDNYAYITEEAPDTIKVIDISNPLMPTTVSTYLVCDNCIPRGLFVDDNNILYTTGQNNALHIINATNVSSLELINITTNSNISSPNSLVVSNNIAYIVGGGITAIDVSNSSNPFFVKSYYNSTTLNGPTDIKVVDDYAYISSRGRTITILDVGYLDRFNYTWYNNSIATYNNNTVPNSITHSGENWTLQCTAFDGELYSSPVNSSSVIILANPVVDSVGITPATAYTTDTLSMNGSCTGGDSWYYAYWTVYNGSSVYSSGVENVSDSSNTQLTTVAPSATTRDETWTLQTLCGNPSVNGTAVNTTRYINNTAPVIISSDIVPSPTANTTEDLVGVCVATDDDNDSLTYNYTWFVDGVNFATDNITYSCYQESADVNNQTGIDNINCGLNYSGSYINTPEVFDNLADSNVINITYKFPSYNVKSAIWTYKIGRYDSATVENVTIPYECLNYNTNELRLAIQDAYSSFNIHPYYMYCYNSSNDWQEIVSYTNTIGAGNGYPGINYMHDGDWNTPAIWHALYGGFGSVPGVADSWGGIFEEAIWWEVEGIIPNNYTTVGENWTLQCQATDGSLYSSLLNSSDTEIINSPPVMFNASFTPSVVYSDTELVGYCGASDVDVTQTLRYYYTWFRDSVANNSGVTGYYTNGVTINVANDSQYHNVNTTWYLMCTPNDGTINGTVLQSSSVTVSDYTPVAVTSDLQPSLVYTNTTLLAYCNVTDADYTTLNYEYTLYRDNVANVTGVVPSVTQGVLINVVSRPLGVVDDGTTWILECRGYDVHGSSDYLNSTARSVFGTPTIDNATFVDTSSAVYPEIGNIIQLNGTVTSTTTVDTCLLNINDNGSWWTPTANTYENIVNAVPTNYVLSFTFNVTTASVAINNNVSWRIECNDTFGTTYISDPAVFTVRDVTYPTVEENQSAINFNLSSNVSVISKELYDLEFSVEYFDYNLFAAEINVTCDEDGQIYYWSEINIPTFNLTKTDSVDLSSYTTQRCTFYTASSDSHTAEEIPDYGKAELDVGLSYYTENDNLVQVLADDSVENIQSVNTKKEVDRYTFEFEFTEKSNTRTFRVLSDKKIYYIEHSDYPAHFVIWNPSIGAGNWVDFADKLSLGDSYTVSKVNDYEYAVVITTPQATDSYSFNSIGGTLVTNTSSEFYIGTIINITSNNLYPDGTDFTNYDFILTADGYLGLNTSGTITSSAIIENVSEADYTITFTHNTALPQTYTQYVNDTWEVVFNSSEAILNFGFRNIKTLTGIVPTNWVLTNDNTGYNLSGTWSNSSVLELEYLDAGNYTMHWESSGYYNGSESFVISTKTNTTRYFSMGFPATFFLYDERTLGEFNISGPDVVRFLLFCPTETVSTIVTTKNFTIPVTCQYDLFTIRLEYGTTGYYRTFILGPDEVNSVKMYLIDLLTTQFIYNSLVSDDLLAKYKNPRIFVYKIIGNETIQITANYVDIENKIGAYLIENHQYIIVIESDNLPTQNLGTYAADLSGTKNIRLYDVQIFDDNAGTANPELYSLGYSNATGDDVIFGRFNDIDEETTQVRFDVYRTSTSTTPIYTSISNDQSVLFSYVYDDENGTYPFNASTVYAGLTFVKNGETTTYQDIIHEFTKITLDILEFVDRDLFQWILIIVLGMIAIMATIATADYIAIALVAVASLLLIFGWLSISASILAIAALVAIISLIKQGEKLA